MPKAILLIIFFGSFINICIFQEVFVDTDYSKAFFAYQKLSQISNDYQSFKDRIAQNTSIEYNKCKEALETLQCNNLDQWHSVISELKMINSNSEQVEIPFLVERKEKKIEKLKGLVAETEVQNNDLEELMTMLQKNQAELIENSKELNAMYKLPYHPQYEFVQIMAKEEFAKEEASKEEAKKEETKEEEAKKEEAPKEEAKKEDASKEEAKKKDAPKEEAKKEDAPKEEAKSKDEKKDEENVPEQLNNDVPNVADEQLSKAKEEYDIADESIQASAASNIFMQYSKKVSETIHHLNEAYELKFNELRMNKEQLKEDIVRARVLISNEKQIQERNQQKMTELKGRIDACKGMPTNLEKDCEPMRATASKLTTEIEIIQGRTDHLHGQLKFLVLNNMHQSTIQQLVPEEEQTDDIQELLNPKGYYSNVFIFYKGPQFEPRKPQELEPKNHYSSEEGEDEAGKKEEPAKEEEAKKEEAPKEEAKKEEAPKEEAKEAPKEEAKKEEAPKEEAKKDEEAPKEEAKKEETKEEKK